MALGIADDLQRQLDADLDMTNLVIDRASQEVVPVRTGRLKRSRRRRGRPNRRVQYRTPYASFVEFGTSRFSGRFYVRHGLVQGLGYLRSQGFRPG